MQVDEARRATISCSPKLEVSAGQLAGLTTIQTDNKYTQGACDGQEEKEEVEQQNDWIGLDWIGLD